MGVGVYENNFNEKGSTFIVDGVIYDMDEAYEQHMKEMGEEDALDEDTFLQVAYEDRYNDIVHVLDEGARKFFTEVQSHLEKSGGELPELGAPYYARADFNNEFRCIYDYNDEIQVGVRQWETDYVV